MDKGFGIGALVLALLACFTPVFGIYVSALAILFAVIAASAGDRSYSVAVPIIAGVNTFVLSPSFWVMMVGAQVQNIAGGLIALVLVFLAAPFAAMAVKSRRSRAAATSASPTGNAAGNRRHAASADPAMRVVSTAATYVSTGDVGEDTWQMIAPQNDKSLLEEFVRRFPDHPRAMMARLEAQRVQAVSAEHTISATTTSVLPTSSTGTTGSIGLVIEAGHRQDIISFAPAPNITWHVGASPYVVPVVAVGLTALVFMIKYLFGDAWNIEFDPFIFGYGIVDDFWLYGFYFFPFLDIVFTSIICYVASSRNKINIWRTFCVGLLLASLRLIIRAAIAVVTPGIKIALNIIYESGAIKIPRPFEGYILGPAFFRHLVEYTMISLILAIIIFRIAPHLYSKKRLYSALCVWTIPQIIFGAVKIMFLDDWEARLYAPYGESSVGSFALLSVLNALKYTYVIAITMTVVNWTKAPAAAVP
jgi:hypothetical protein